MKPTRRTNQTYREVAVKVASLSTDQIAGVMRSMAVRRDGHYLALTPIETELLANPRFRWRREVAK